MNLKTLLWTTLLILGLITIGYAYYFMPIEIGNTSSCSNASTSSNNSNGTTISKPKVIVILKTTINDDTVAKETVDSLLMQTMKPSEITVESENEYVNDPRVTVHKKGTLPVREMDANVCFVLATNGRIYSGRFVEEAVETFLKCVRR